MFNPHVIKRWVAGGLVIAAASFSPAAQARVIGGGGGGVPVAPPVTAPAVQQRLDQLQRNVKQRFAAEGGWHLSAPSAPAAAISSGGFRWRDAGIGAAGAVVLVGASAGAASLMRRRRPYRPVGD